MNNKSLRYSKLMKSMGIPQESSPVRPAPEAESMEPQKIEAVTGAEHPEMQKNRQLVMLIDSKIAQLEQSDDPNALESLNFWKQKRAELSSN